MTAYATYPSAVSPGSVFTIAASHPDSHPGYQDCAQVIRDTEHDLPRGETRHTPAA